MGSILLFVIVLSLLVFVHELGHFLMAKKMGMKVEEFGFGFPPRIFGIKKGDTTYSINWIPLGGFVKIKGESGEHAGDSDSFASKSAMQRFIVLIAGVVMNLFLAAVLLSIGFMIGLPTMIDDNTPSYARVTNQELAIVQVVENSPAALAGVEAGDRIDSIDGTVFVHDTDARDYILAHADEGIQMVFHDREGNRDTQFLVAEDLPEFDIRGIGIGFVQSGIVSFAPHHAIVQGIGATITFTVEVVKAFGNIIIGLVQEQRVTVDLAGPVGIAVMTGEVAALGFVYLIQFVALLSVNLAVINVFPFPALDGGRILFLIIAKVRGRPVSENVEGAIHNAGFALLLLLIVLVTYKDLVTFLG